MYDTLRLGAVTDLGEPVASASGQPAQDTQRPSAQPPLPQTASALVISTIGVSAALRVAAGFLLAVGPLAVMALLFDATSGVFSGWVRVLAGSTLATMAASIVTALYLVMVESEVARLQAYTLGGASVIVDPQAITTLTLVFALVMLVSVFAAARLTSAFRLPSRGSSWRLQEDTNPPVRHLPTAATQPGNPSQIRSIEATQVSRATMVADTLSTMARREARRDAVSSGLAAPDRSAGLGATSRQKDGRTQAPLGVAGRRTVRRRSLSASRRDRA